MEEGFRILTDKGTGRPILMSPGRVKRPRNTGAEDDGAKDCPFCEGNEAETPPEEDAVRREGTAPDSPGWQVRAFPNRYPAAACHEVIAEGSHHTRHPAELSTEILGHSIRVLRRRIAAAESRSDVVCAFWFKNVGATAGASIEHNHSQLLGLPTLPPRLAAELSAYREHGCIHCLEIASAAAEGRVIYDGPDHVILSPSTPKLPYEVWLLPRDHGDEFMTATADANLVLAMHELYAGVDRAFDGGDFNTFLHRVPGEDFHWHVEVQPRVGNLAALELGGDMYINAVTAQASARRWRGE